MRFNLVISLLAGSSLALTGTAFAQDATDGSAQTAAASDIIVTGTRIQSLGYTAPTPVTTTSTEALLNTTPSSIPDALNKLPQFSNSLSPGKSSSNWSNIPIHGNVLNLRSLGTPSDNPKGPLRTLILFDGIRVPATSYVGTVDTNVLPQLLMQRVDVVTGGASASYGSDAVAGVVNFILDKKFTGIKGVAQAGVSGQGDNASQRLGVAGGWNFSNERGHILFSAEYNNAEGMLRRDREIGRQGYTFVGKNVGGGAPGTDGNPYVIGRDVLISALAPNGRIVGSSVTGNPFVGQVINNDGSTRPFDFGQPTGTTGFQTGGDGYTIPDDNYAIVPYKTYQTFGRLSYDVTPDINAYAQGIWSRTDMSYTAMQNSLVPPSVAVNVYKGNPYLSPALDASLTGPDDYITVGQYKAGQPMPVVSERTDFWMATAGLEGKFSSFTWDVNYTHGQSTHHMGTAGLYNTRTLYAATDAVTDPATGAPTCRVLLDPALAGQYAGCSPMDVLHGNPNASTPDGYAYATGTSRYRALLKQDVIQANISGSIFELPAGSVDLAIGAEYRHQSLDLVSNANPANLTGDTPAETSAIRSQYFNGLRGVPSGALYYWLINVGDAQGSVNVKEAFAELAVPLVKDTPGIQELGLNGAVRVTNYSTSGTVTTWKLGGTWRPVDDLLLRATYSRDIRAPNLFELFAGGQSGIGIINDLQITDAGGNPIYGSGLNLNANALTAGNQDLKPEIGKTLTIGGALTPSFLPGLSLSVDYYRINVSSIIDTLQRQQIVTNCYDAGGTGAVECGLIDRATPTSFPSMIHVIPANIAFLKTSGFDIDATYRTSLGDNGSLGAHLYLNYLSKFDSQQYVGAPIAHYAGVSVVGSNPAGFPRWRGNFSLDYNNGPFGMTLSEQYIGPMRLDIPGGPVPIVFENDHVPAVWYTDLNLRMTIPTRTGDFQVFGNISNLFDKKPPVIPGTVPGVNLSTNIAVYDIVGRAFTAGVRFNF